MSDGETTSLLRPSRRAALSMGLGAALGGPITQLCLPSDAAIGAAVTPALFRRGTNTWPWFSLTREYPAPRTDYPWPPLQPQRPIPSAGDLSRIAAVGFDFVRIPVDPGPFLSATPVYRALLLKGLLAAVEEAKGAGFGVIVNLQCNDATHYWNSQTLLLSTQAPQFLAYRALVAEVALELGHLNMPRLALEPVNEPPQACGSAAWSSVQVSLLTAARDAAPNLTLVATGSCGSMVSGLQALNPVPLAAFAPILYTFHFYEPYLFTHQGAPWMQEPVYRSLNAVPWPASAGSLKETLAAVRLRMSTDTGISASAKAQAYAITERLMGQYFVANPDYHFIDYYLDGVSAWATTHKIPKEHILMGEFGSVKTGGSIVAAHPADRVRYIRDVREAAEARGFAWAFWNLFSEEMGFMDDATRALDPDVVDALGLKMPPA